MTLTIEGADLTRAVKAAAAVVPNRSTIPVIEGLLIEAGGHGLTISATDMDRFVAVSAVAECAAPFTALVDARRLAAIAAALSSGAQVTLSLSDHWLTVASGRARWRLGLIPADEFPRLNTVDAAPVEFPAKALASALGRAAYAISSEVSRYYICGAFLRRMPGEDGSDRLRIAATDGHRLAVVDLPWPKGAEAGGLEAGVIVPANAVADIRRHAESCDRVTLAVTETLMRVEAGAVVMTTRLITGTYPDYERIIPNDPPNRSLVDSPAMLTAIRRAEAVAAGIDDTTRGRGIYLAPTGATMTVAGQDAGAGDALDRIDAEFEGEMVGVGVNGRYLREALEAMDADTVRMALTDALAAVLITAVGDDDQRHVLMPYRLTRPPAIDSLDDSDEAGEPAP